MGFFDSLFGKKKEEKKPEEKRICPVCGNSFTGKGMDVHDGIICLDCWDLVLEDFEMGRMDEDKEFYIAPIKAAVLAKKGELAADKNISVYYEGITLSEDNYALYVSDHRVKTGAILVVDIGTKEMRTIYEAEGLDPADLTLTDKALFIPDIKNHRILKLEL